MNLYAYCGNNPVNYKQRPVSFGGSITISSIFSTAKGVIFSLGSVDSSRDKWKNKWFDTDWPGFFVLTRDGFEVVNWSLSIYKGGLYFDNNENNSLYIAVGNIGIYSGINFKKGIGIEASASVLEIGYDGRIIDVSIKGLAIGITYMYKDGEFKFGYDAGWYGFSISIDFVEIFKLLFGGE